MRDHGITVQNITISDQMLLYDLLFNYWELTRTTEGNKSML